MGKEIHVFVLAVFYLGVIVGLREIVCLWGRVATKLSYKQRVVVIVSFLKTKISQH